ncbi:MAG: hypothetical protein BM556_02960 [Bacteriovorax sp. MedPE-SWde]|nr:MAG: hypothetical protein BM556_02960 [Bacteriovorax sp. MedPE-SWde]
MKRFGMILSYCNSSGRGIIEDGKGKKYSFSKRFTKKTPISKNTPVEFELQIEDSKKTQVAKLQVPRTSYKRDTFLRMFELEKNQLELPFVG